MHTNGTVGIVQSYGEKISAFMSEKDKGIYDSFNKGISLVAGDFIAFLHSDDLYVSSSVVEDIMKEFTSNDSLDGV